MNQTIFTALGDHDEQWVEGSANITSGADFRIVFDGSLPYMISSVVAVDDIKVLFSTIHDIFCCCC